MKRRIECLWLLLRLGIALAVLLPVCLVVGIFEPGAPAAWLYDAARRFVAAVEARSG